MDCQNRCLLLGRALFLLFLWHQSGVHATQCHKFDSLNTAEKIDRVLKLKTVSTKSNENCDNSDCHVIRRKNGTESLKLNCGKCTVASPKSTELCDECASPDGCNNAIGALASAKSAYRRCLKYEGAALTAFDESKEVYCTGGATCQLLEYSDISKAERVVYDCSPECAQKSLILGATAVTRACSDCDLDSEARPQYCKLGSTAATSQKPTTSKPVGTSKPGRGGDKNLACCVAYPAELSLLASAVAAMAALH